MAASTLLNSTAGFATFTITVCLTILGLMAGQIRAKRNLIVEQDVPEPIRRPWWFQAAAYFDVMAYLVVAWSLLALFSSYVTLLLDIVATIGRETPENFVACLGAYRNNLSQLRAIALYYIPVAIIAEHFVAPRLWRLFLPPGARGYLAGVTGRPAGIGEVDDLLNRASAELRAGQFAVSVLTTFSALEMFLRNLFPQNRRAPFPLLLERIEGVPEPLLHSLKDLRGLRNRVAHPTHDGPAVTRHQAEWALEVVREFIAGLTDLNPVNPQ